MYSRLIKQDLSPDLSLATARRGFAAIKDNYTLRLHPNAVTYVTGRLLYFA